MMYYGRGWGGGGFWLLVGLLLLIALIVLIVWAVMHLSPPTGGHARPLAPDTERDTPRALRPRRDHRAGVRRCQEGPRPGPMTRRALLVGRGRRNVSMLNVDRLARVLSADLPTLMAGVEAKRSQ